MRTLTGNARFVPEVLMALNRLARSYRKLRAGPFRPRVLVTIGGVAVIAFVLLYGASGLDEFRRSAYLEVGADLVGTIIVVAILTPLLTRAREGRIRERGRLDHDLFTDNVAAATSVVRILDTYSNLFDRPQTPQALAALEAALGRSARVQILLLHPDSTAATVRAEEIHTATIRREILRNVRVLHEFTDRLDRETIRNLEIRLYQAAASSTLYRWDDRALIAFLSLGRHTSQGNQLEIDVDSSLGLFVEQHFDELWSEATTLDEFLRLRLSLSGIDDGDREFALPYVLVDRVPYLADPQVLAHLAQVNAGSGTIVATVAGRTDERFHLQVVNDDDEQLRETLTEHFMEKYAWPGQAYFYLTPVPTPVPSKLRRIMRS